jgi:hypothetical protein
MEQHYLAIASAYVRAPHCRHRWHPIPRQSFSDRIEGNRGRKKMPFWEEADSRQEVYLTGIFNR